MEGRPEQPFTTSSARPLRSESRNTASEDQTHASDGHLKHGRIVNADPAIDLEIELPSEPTSMQTAFLAWPARDPRITRALVDLPTTLIDYWFSNVCQMWSTFDSDVNYKRQIPTIYCTSSEVISTALQTMAAACLSCSVLSIREAFPSLESRAGAAIVQRLARLQKSPTEISREIPTDLVFAVLALGTSLHWARSSHHDDVLYTSACSLLALWEAKASNVDPLHLAFFRQAFVYWGMLLSISNAGFEHPTVKARHRVLRDGPGYELSGSDQPSVLLLYGGSATLRGTRPHSSCGISSEVVDLFSQVLTLCRNAHKRQSRARLVDAEAAAYDLAVAQELQHELQDLDFESVVRTDELLGFSLHTGDDAAPLSHHIQTAEAYRLAALLQLHLVFDRLPEGVASGGGKAHNTSRYEQLISLAAQLVGNLESIPANSGVR